MGKKLEDYITEKNLGLQSETVLEALRPVLVEIRKDALSEFEDIDFSCYQIVDNREAFLLSLKLKLVKEIEAGLERQIASGRAADQTIKEHQKK